MIEDRNWIADALTGDRVIAMPVFRRLCPEQLLRPGDDAEIGRITILFTDLVGSTSLYDSLGDATAYNLVRDHFAFLSERVERHNGFIVKTVGDAVMAAFSHSDDAVRAALAIQDEVAAFNSANRTGAIALKLGLHSGACIAVTAAGVLDYFGATVNIAARLEHQCAPGEVVVSGVDAGRSRHERGARRPHAPRGPGNSARLQRPAAFRARTPAKGGRRMKPGVTAWTY